MYTMEALIEFLRAPCVLAAAADVAAGRKNLKNAFEEHVHDFLKRNCVELTDRVFENTFTPEERDKIAKGACGFIEKKMAAGRDSFVAQPFGSQAKPDFIIFRVIGDRVYFICLECKSSKKKAASMWNCSAPKPFAHWIYAHKGPTYVFVAQGCHLITKEDFESIEAMCANEQLKAIVAEAKKRNTSKQWEFYIRNMINQKFSYPLEKRDEYLDDAARYIASMRPTQHELGQYFTPPSMAQSLVDFLTERKLVPSSARVLEPSCGNGVFCQLMRSRGHEVKCFDIDQTTACQAKKIKNTLEMPFDREFDLVIGNPPYVELSDYKVSRVPESKLATGRYNTWALFVEHGVNALRIGGILAFILPTSMLAAPTYQKLRDWLVARGEIVDICVLGKFSADVAQEVIRFVYRRTDAMCSAASPFVIASPTRFAESVPISAPRRRIGDISTVTTGAVVWNAVATHAERKEGDLTLIYHTDIDSIAAGAASPLDLPPKPAGKKAMHEKHRYLATTKTPLKLPVLLVTRTAVPECALLADFTRPVIAENHINVISAPLGILQEIVAFFGTQSFLEQVKRARSTRNFSKTQLEVLEI